MHCIQQAPGREQMDIDKQQQEKQMAGVPKLIILSEQLRGRTFELTKDLHTVGRVDERDICIKDPTISTYHCAFIRDGNTYILKDQGSTNGTRVNNVPITEQVLQNSDILQIGGVELLYDCDDKSVTTVMRTQTGINIDAGEISTIKKLAPTQNEEIARNKFSQKLLFIIILLLLIMVAALIAVLVYQTQKGDQEETSMHLQSPAGPAEYVVRGTV